MICKIISVPLKACLASTVLLLVSWNPVPSDMECCSNLSGTTFQLSGSGVGDEKTFYNAIHQRVSVMMLCRVYNAICPTLTLRNVGQMNGCWEALSSFLSWQTNELTSRRAPFLVDKLTS